jgi:hypothetical protein
MAVLTEESPLASFEFVDLDSGDDGYCSVTSIPNGVGIALSLRGDGDIEVFLSPENARKLARLIEEAQTLKDHPSQHTTEGSSR